MKNMIVRGLFTLSLSAVLSPLALLAQNQINATVPFDFTIGAKSSPAGDYNVRQVSDYVLLVQSIKDRTGVMTMIGSGRLRGERIEAVRAIRPTRTPRHPTSRY